MLHGNAIIGQSGGPTSVINASLCGIVEAVPPQQRPSASRWACGSASKASCGAT